MKYKLIALDYDGTLLTDDKKILPETEKALMRAHDEGIIILPATGRMLWGVFQVFLPVFDCAITCNGAAVYNLKTKECIAEHTMPKERALEILQKLRRFDISVDAFIGGAAYKETSEKELIDHLPVSQAMKDFIRNSRNYVDDLSEYIEKSDRGVQKFTLNFAADNNGGFIHREDVRIMLENIPEITVVCGGMNNLEITEKGISKGTGLNDAAKYFKIDRSETIAFGDSENDLEMIKAAGLGIAMENSTPEIIAAADFVTRSNNENGIAYALDKFIFS